MGKTGHPSAADLLDDLIADEQDTNVLIRARESLASLGDVEQAVRLEGYTRGPFADDRIDAIRAVARLGGPRAKSLLEYLVSKYEDPALVRVAAAGGLGRMGTFSQNGYNLCIRSLTDAKGVLHESDEDGRVPNAADIRALRQLAAISLGWIGQDPAVDALYPMLSDEDGNIRVGAAMSILRLLPEGEEQPVEPAPEADELDDE
jgi:HEAT repeat protein